MDYKTIEDEIHNFSAMYFADIAYYTEFNLSFITKNNLLISKQNYTFLIEYLNKTLTTFETLDKQFLNSILKKLITDVNQLCKLYDQIKKKYI